MSRPSPQFLCSATRWRTTRDPLTLLQVSDYLSPNQSTALLQKARNWNSAGSKWSVWRWRERNQNRPKKAILRKSPKKQTLMVSKQRKRTFLKDFSTDVAMQLVRKVLTLLLTLHRLAAPSLLDCLSYSICPEVPIGFKHNWIKRKWTSAWVLLDRFEVYTNGALVKRTLRN